MPALPKPHRIAVLLPEVKIDGPDAAYEREAAILVWTALVETCRRHPRLSVLDADATPLFPQDGHFAPQHAGRGARPNDAFFGPTRRDELIWLELSLGSKPGAVRLHALGREGKQESFDALGRNAGEQIQQVLGAWLTARKLGVLPRPFEAVSSEELLATLRVIAPVLAEQARAWSLPTAAGPTWSLAVVEDTGGDDEDDDERVSEDDVLDELPALESTVDSTLEIDMPADPVRRSLARPLVPRLPAVFRVAALRTLELALREDLADLVLGADPAHPHGERVPDRPSALEAVAIAGMAALRRPATLEVLERAADALAGESRVDEALRLLDRAVALHDDDPRAHLALLDLHRLTGRVGAWLERALASAAQHGCPLDPALPWYPDQIRIDLRASTALLHAGRLGEAISLRGNRLSGREPAWPAQVRALEHWQKDPRFVAWCYGREGAYRGDDARTIEGFGRIEPGDPVDLALLLDALVALGREDEAPLAWAQYGLGHDLAGAPARLAAAQALMAAGEWRRGMEELWRVELAEPGRDEHPAIARLGLVLSGAPIEVIETALGDRVAIGAPTLARRMARDAADFVPMAAKSGLVARALGRATSPQGEKATLVDFDPDWLAGFAEDTRSRRALDAMFGELGRPRRGPPSGFDVPDELQRGDRLVNRWLEVAFTEASEDDPAALAQAAAYTAAQALGRYLAWTTAPPSTIAGALRTVAGEALALVRRHRTALADGDARALLGTLDPLLRRVDRWIGMTWLGKVERAVGVDERSGGDVAGFVRDYPVVAARILGPEETAVLTASVAQLHRERPAGWAPKVAAQASRLASHTGFAGTDEWADAVAAQLAARELELEDSIDALHTACYLAEGRSAGPCVHLARVLFDAGRAPAAVSVLCAGLRAARPAWRDAQLATLAPAWQAARLDTPFAFADASAAVGEALQKGDAARAEKLARWAVALEPTSADAHRQLGLALAQQGKLVDSMHHLVRGAGEQATQVLSGVLFQRSRAGDAMTVLDYASRWYTRADQWLAYAGIAYAAMDNPRTVKAYALAYELDPGAFDASALAAYAGVLEEVGDHATRERIAAHLRRVAGHDLAALPERTAGRTRSGAPPVRPRDPVYALLEAGDHAAAAQLLADPSWRVRRAALHAVRFRTPAENQVDVTPRARGAAAAVLAATVGTMDLEALLARSLALRIREQAYFARDPVPRLGDRPTREAFFQDFRGRGGVLLGEAGPPAPAFVDRVVVPGSRVARTSDYIALLRDLAALPPREALAQFDLDENGYLELARAWAVAMERDPSIARTIEAGLAQR